MTKAKALTHPRDILLSLPLMDQPTATAQLFFFKSKGSVTKPNQPNPTQENLLDWQQLES
jgi:hypothetical protein